MAISWAGLIPLTSVKMDSGLLERNHLRACRYKGDPDSFVSVNFTEICLLCNSPSNSGFEMAFVRSDDA